MNKQAFTLQFIVIAFMGCVLSTAGSAQTDPRLLKLSELRKFYPSNARNISERFQKRFQEKVSVIQKDIDLTNYLKPKLLIGNISDVELAKMKNFNWRTYNAVTPVKDQGSSGACWAFAVTAAIESNYIIRRNQTLDLAEQDLINCGCRNSSVCQPATGPDLLANSDQYVFYNNLINTGLNVERANRFKGDGNCNVCQECNQTIIKPFGIDAMGWVEPINGVSTVIETKRALLKYGPVVIGIEIPDSSQFWALKGDAVFNEDKTDYSVAAAHIILLVGWNDSRKAWLIKNSWGTGWGNEGFGWLAYGSNRETKSGRQYVVARMPQRDIEQTSKPLPIAYKKPPKNITLIPKPLPLPNPNGTSNRNN